MNGEIDLRELRHHLGNVLKLQPCKHTFELTKTLIKIQGEDLEDFREQFEEQGGYCDCEIYNNVLSNVVARP